MTCRRDNPWTILGWLLVSVVIHAGAALYAGSCAWGARQETPGDLDDSRVTHPEDVRPGIERSDAMVISWIGFDEPTPHSATPSDYDQPALTLDPGSPSATPIVESPAPGPEVAATPAPTAHDLERAMRVIGARVEQSAAVIADGGRHLRDSARESVAPLRELLARLMRTPTSPVSSTAQVDPAEPRPAATPAERTQSPADGGKGEQGAPSDRESAPVSIANVPIQMRELGNPLAAAGLDIKTIRPRFTHYTQLTVRPNNPLIRVEFDRGGRVVKAELLESSGHRDVDNPILDAVYRWTAAGKPLETLGAAGSPATIPIEFRIVL